MTRLVLAALAALLPIGCGGSVSPGTPADSRLLAVATTGPVGDAVVRLAGDRLDVEVLVGPGIDPHTYKPVPSDLRKLGEADAVFYNGLGLEGRLGDAIDSLTGDTRVVAVTERLEESADERLLRPDGYDGVYDPHVWHDVSLWADCVTRIADELCELDPDGESEYRSRLAELQEELAALHEDCLERFASVPEDARMLVTAHDAFGYFSEAYDLESVGLKGVSTEDEVDLGQMQRVAEMLAERNVPCVFIESAVSPQIVEALVEAAEAEGHSVRIGGELYADALGPAGSGADTYAGMIRTNVDTIVAGLTGEDAPTPGDESGADAEPAAAE